MVWKVGIAVKKKRMFFLLVSMGLMLTMLSIKSMLELNLKRYAPYYAQNTIEGRFSPEWEALRYMLYRNPVSIEGYSFKQDTLTNNISLKIRYKEKPLTLAIYGDEGAEINIYYNDNMYRLDDSGALRKVLSGRCNCIVNQSEEDEKLVGEIIKEIGSPLVNAQTAPDLNLQWLYNLLNQKR